MWRKFCIHYSQIVSNEFAFFKKSSYEKLEIKVYIAEIKSDLLNVAKSMKVIVWLKQTKAK